LHYLNKHNYICSCWYEDTWLNNVWCL
jgi:hypothetical protein